MTKIDALKSTSTHKAVSMLNGVWPVVEEAYHALMEDGMSSKKARTFCMSVIDIAFIGQGDG